MGRAPASLPRILPNLVKLLRYTERSSSALSTGMFLGSPVPMKKWHLSEQAPQRTQMSIKIFTERNFSSRSLNPSYKISCQFSGSCQSSSRGFHWRALGNPRVSTLFGLEA
jgi:hypothetical protein